MDLAVVTALPFRPQIISPLSSTGEVLRFATIIEHSSHAPNSREQQVWYMARNTKEVQDAFSRCLLNGVTTEITFECADGLVLHTAFIRNHGAAAVIAISHIKEQAPSQDLPSQLSNRLTSRQLEICKLQSEGICTKEIGRQLEISESAVNSHRNAAMETLGCARREQLGVMLARAGLVSPVKTES